MPLTVFERWTDYGEEMLLKAALGQASAASSVYCHLFKSPTTDPADETPTLVEADFDGYGAVGFVWQTVSDPTAAGLWQALSNIVCTFLRGAGATSNTVYGYYLTCNVSGWDADEPVYYRFFNDGQSLTPKTMATESVDQITIIPRVGLIGLEDVVCPEA